MIYRELFSGAGFIRASRELIENSFGTGGTKRPRSEPIRFLPTTQVSLNETRRDRLHVRTCRYSATADLSQNIYSLCLYISSGSVTVRR